MGLVLDAINKYGLQDQVAALCQEYFEAVHPIYEGYPGLKEIPQPDERVPYYAFSQEILPYWRQLANEVRKLIRNARKGG